MTSGRSALGLAGWLAASFAAAGLGGIATASSVADWYPTLAKPAWTPPSWLFGPVWTVLYASMAVAAWTVWKKAGGFGGARGALLLHLLQLVLNGAWSWLFFGMRRPGLAAVEIAVLWLAVLATTVAFARRSPLAGGLMVPYLLWVTFASALNVAIWRLN
jgi:tryptophan-rich sensory protein